MFKKTLLAATLAALSTSAMAVDVATNSTLATYGSEALTASIVPNDFTVLQLGATQLILGAEYSVGDTIRVSISGGEFDIDDAFELTDNDGGAATALITMGLIDVSSTGLLFRVTGIDVTNGPSTLTQTLDFELAGAVPVPVKVNSSTVGAELTVSAAAATSTGLSIDSAGTDNSFVIGEVIKQHVFAVPAAMASDVDVAKARKEFDTPANATFSVTYAETTPTQAGMGIADTTYTINGSMTGFEATVAATDNGGTITGNNLGALTVAVDIQSASDATGTVPSATEAFTFAVDATAADRAVISVGSYTVDVEIEAAGGEKFTYSGLAAGSFALNGANATYAYAPVNYSGAVTTQFEIGNSGVVDGEITVSGFDTAGTAYSAVLPFNADAGKLTSVSDAAIATALGLTTGTKLQLSFTVNAPSDDITFGGYSNRGTTGRMALTPEL